MDLPKEEAVVLFIMTAIGVWLSWENKLTQNEVSLLTYCFAAWCGSQGLKNFGPGNKDGK
jgi:NhaP-type Na+/H+ or K+/H+ antiporter